MSHLKQKLQINHFQIEKRKKMKIIIWVTTGGRGSKNECNFEIDDEDLEGRTEEQKEKVIDQQVYEYICNNDMFTWGWRKQ